MRGVLWTLLLITASLAGCSEDAGGDEAGPETASATTTTTETPEPGPVYETQAYQSEHTTVQVGNPAVCFGGAPPASGFGPNGIDAYGFGLLEDSEGLAYNFTAGQTGQELEDYVVAFLNEDFSEVIEAPSVAPGETLSGTIPAGAAWVYLVLCAGGTGAGDFVSYVTVQVG